MSIESNTGKGDVLAGLMGGQIAATPLPPKPEKRKRGRPKAVPLNLPKADWDRQNEDEAARLNREWLSVDNDAIWTEVGRWHV